LINTGLADSGPLVRKSIADLGFKASDVKWLMATHAHYDHVAALAEMQKATGARVLATAAETPLLEDGGKSDFHLGAAYRFAPVKVDDRLSDGQKVNLGGMEITVHLHPGHTRGAASYSFTVHEAGRDYRVLIANIGSINNGVRLTANAKYPQIADDYAKTFASQKLLSCDVFLASHASQYRLHEKYTPGMPYDPNRFVDPEGYRRAVAAAEAAYRKQLAAERGGDRARIEELHRMDTIAAKGNDLVLGKAAAGQFMKQFAAAAKEFEAPDYR
jgi:metallo-beta-lactamase class B